MNKVLLVISVMFWSVLSLAGQQELINQVLFEVNKSPVTTQDFKDYMAAKKKMNFQNLSFYVKNELQEFILFHVALLQNESLEQRDPVQVNPQNLVVSLNKVKDYLKTREKQNSSAERFEIWFNLMKRKHHYISKVVELEK